MDDTTTIQNSLMTLAARDAEFPIGMDACNITKSLPQDHECIDILTGKTFIIAIHDPVVAVHADRAIRIVDGLIASIDATGGSVTQ